MAEKKGAMDAVKGYLSGEFNEVKKKGAWGYAKNNPLKTAGAVFLLPLDWAIGGVGSFVVTTAVVTAAGAKAVNDFTNDETGDKKKDNKFTARLGGNKK